MATARITWQDTLRMPEDGKRYEAIDGELYVTAAPFRRHQRVSLNLATALHALLDASGLGWVYHAPIGVEFPKTEEGVQPDIVFVSRLRDSVLVKEGIRGAPDLVIEILSPSTAGRDRTIKKKLYERQGVGQYWIVDPDAESVEIWDFGAGATKPTRYLDRLPVSLRTDPVGEISLAKIFEPEL
jgi:Uma2 family endonuclease